MRYSTHNQYFLIELKGMRITNCQQLFIYIYFHSKSVEYNFQKLVSFNAIFCDHTQVVNITLQLSTRFSFWIALAHRI